MKIDKSKCVGRGNRQASCTMGVIYVDEDRRSMVNEEECVECSNCYHSLRNRHENPTLVRALRKVVRLLHLSYDPPLDVCPTGALTPPDLAWPRVVRARFSNPLVAHPSTGVSGPRTEEIRTDDVTNRLQEGEVGFVVELGRPGLGARFSDAQEVSRVLAALGARFEPHNPVTSLMTDTSTGDIRPDVLDQKVLSLIIELKAPLEAVPRLLAALKKVAGELGTVMSVGIGGRCGADRSLAYRALVRQAGFILSLSGKTNLGLRNARWACWAGRDGSQTARSWRSTPSVATAWSPST